MGHYKFYEILGKIKSRDLVFKDFKDFINFKIRVVFPYSEWGGGVCFCRSSGIKVYEILEILEKLNPGI